MSSEFDISVDSHSKRLVIAFPSRVVSTNVDALRGALANFWETPDAKLTAWDKMTLDFPQTEFVDSIGLNLIFDLVKLAQERDAKVEAKLTSRAVRLIFYTVRLDKKMDIHLLESAE